MSPDADSEEAHVQNNIDVEMNEDAVKGELDRRTVEIEIKLTTSSRRHRPTRERRRPA